MIFLSELYLTAWTELPCNFVQRLYRNQVKVFHRGVWISNVTACIDLPGLTWATSLNLFIWQIQVRGTQISNRIACIRFTRLELSCISLCKNEEVISPLKISVHGKIECVLTVCCDFIASSLWGNYTMMSGDAVLFLYMHLTIFTLNPEYFFEHFCVNNVMRTVS